MDLSIVKIVGSGSILLILTVIVLSRLKKQPYLFTGWFWFLGTLVPVIGIVKIGDFDKVHSLIIDHVLDEVWREFLSLKNVELYECE